MIEITENQYNNLLLTLPSYTITKEIGANGDNTLVHSKRKRIAAKVAIPNNKFMHFNLAQYNTKSSR